LRRGGRDFPPLIHRISLALLCISIYAAIPLYGDDFTVAMLFAFDSPPDEERLQYLEMLKVSLMPVLSEADFIPVFADDTSAGSKGFRVGIESVSIQSALRTREDTGSDLVLTGFLSFEGKRMFVQLKLFDPGVGSFIGAGSASGFSGLSGFNLVQEAVDGIAGDLAASKQVIEKRRALDARTVKRILFTSEEEGMELSLADGTLLGTIKKGNLEVQGMDHRFLLGDKIIIQKSKEGYYSQTESVRLNETDQAIHLGRLRKKTDTAVLVEISEGQLPGAGVGFRKYIVPDYFYAEVLDAAFLQFDFYNPAKPAFHNDLDLVVGCYLFFSPRSPFRLGVSSGLGGILTVLPVKDSPLYIDVYLNPANLFLELNLKNVAFYAKVVGKYSLDLGNNLLDRGWISIPDSGPVVSVGVMKKW